MAAGILQAIPDAEVESRPLADGGEGTLEALLAARGGRARPVSATGPLGERVRARFGIISSGARVVEMASASGLWLVPGEKRPLEASSVGTGECVRSALADAGSGTELVVAIGGSASTDGGTGAARALGWRFLDELGRDLPPGGGALRGLHAIVPPEQNLLSDAAVTGAYDVDSPLLGDDGAARAFARQKGASATEVELLEEGMHVFAARVEADVGLRVDEIPGAGAGGGMGAGVVAFMGGRLRSGFDLVAEAVDLEQSLAAADVVVTGEGRLDHQSLRGKVTVGVARRARRTGTPALVIAGHVALEDVELTHLGFHDWEQLVDAVPARSELDPSSALRRKTKNLFSRLSI